MWSPRPSITDEGPDNQFVVLTHTARYVSTMDEDSNTTDDATLRERLTPEQFHVTQEAGTERAFTGKYWDEKKQGMYRCVVCGEPLFASTTKYDSGSGWPSFTAPLQPGAVTETSDVSFGMVRTESRCAQCDAHLGHVFPDGPGAGGLRYCINSASLELDEQEPIDADADTEEPT